MESITQDWCTGVTKESELLMVPGTREQKREHADMLVLSLCEPQSVDGDSHEHGKPSQS